MIFSLSSDFSSLYTDFPTRGAVGVAVDHFSRHTQIFLLYPFILGRGHSCRACMPGSSVYHVPVLTSRRLGGGRRLAVTEMSYLAVTVDRDRPIARFLLFTHLSLRLHFTSLGSLGPLLKLCCKSGLGEGILYWTRSFPCVSD